MSINIIATFDITFLSNNGGTSNTSIKFSLPEHPTIEITDKMKRLTIEEIEAVCHAMLKTKVFGDN